MTNPAITNAPTRRVTVNGEVVGPGNPLPVQVGNQDGDQADVTQPEQMDFHAARVIDHEFKKLQAQMDELIRIQRGMLRLLEAAFDDDLSSEISEEL